MTEKKMSSNNPLWLVRGAWPVLVLAGIFAVLKHQGVLDWSWLAVTSPVWGLVLVLVIGFGALALSKGIK